MGNIHILSKRGDEMSDVILKAGGKPYVSEVSAKQQLAAKGLQETHVVKRYSGDVFKGYCIAPKQEAATPEREPTPCEKLGYKVGDSLLFTGCDHHGFNEGEIVTLDKDDNSDTPWFKCGERRHCAYLSDTKPLPITLRPGDYVLTKGMDEETYHAVAAAFMAAGAGKGEYPNVDQMQCVGLNCFGWHPISSALYHGRTKASSFRDGRQLTPAQVLGAANGLVVQASTGDPELAESQDDDEAIQCEQEGVVDTVIATLHLARQQKEQAWAAYIEAERAHELAVDAVNAELQGFYRLQERDGKQPDEVPEMKDLTPEEWKSGDVVKCVSRGMIFFTFGKEYFVKEGCPKGGTAFTVQADDEGDVDAVSAACFRFVRRP